MWQASFLSPLPPVFTLAQIWVTCLWTDFTKVTGTWWLQLCSLHWFAFCLWRPQCVKNWRSTCIHCGGQAFREHFLSFQKKKSKAQTNYWSLEVVWCLSVRACKKGGMQWSSKFRTLGDFWEIPPALVKDIVTVGDINVQIKPAAL